ncbi:MAG: amidohydrolase family protein, partial [Spirochaetaceae bacterium]|nr:amidohydrolase family protein [Spirochaetaceae bacterium]
CPAIAHGVSDLIGYVQVGKLSDLTLWKPAFFGVHPEAVLKGGFIAFAAMGDANASIPTPQPVWGRPMFGAHGAARASTCVTFVSAAARDAVASCGSIRRRVEAVHGTRDVSKRDLPRNDALPVMEVDPDSYEFRADGEPLTCEPLAEVPLAQRYFMF